MRFYRWVKKWAERVAALRIPLYAGNSAFFLLLSLFPLMSILLAILQRTSLQEADVLRLLAQVSPAALMPLFEDLLDGLYDVQPVSLISISAVTVVWSSSKGMYRLLLGLNAVAGVTVTRGYARLRLRARLCPGCCWPSLSRSCSTSTGNRCSACSARAAALPRGCWSSRCRSCISIPRSSS